MAAKSAKQQYEKQIVPQLCQELGIDNPLACPKLEKIIVSMGLGEAIINQAAMDKAIEDLKQITGQQPIQTVAKKSIASFKLRQGMKIGLKVTLRRDRMYAFWERLVHVALPRTRDFRGVSVQSFDQAGNFNLGIREQIIFPEIDFDTIDRIRGLQVTIVTSTKDLEAAKKLLKLFGMPFKDY